MAYTLAQLNAWAAGNEPRNPNLARLHEAALYFRKQLEERESERIGLYAELEEAQASRDAAEERNAGLRAALLLHYRLDARTK